MKRRWLVLASVVVIALLGAASGCSSVRYYTQAISGHLALMHAARPIEESIDDRATPAELRRRLERALAIREFASRELGLPDNGSYRRYADLKRSHVVWNVFAAEEFSVNAKESCFPVVGCVAYRGFYAEADAREFGEARRAEGLDVFVYGVAAYSTLGWFDDPLLNTFIGYPEAELARVIFHELAHQVVYTRDDTAFNESFAVAVEEEGVRRWLARHGTDADRAAFEAARARRKDFVALIQRYQALLAQAYARDAGAADKRAEKRRLFAAMRADYEGLKRSWGGYAGFDRWFARDLNNAHLASVATYGDFVPAFQVLLAREGGDLEAFYREVRRLARLSRSERSEMLAALASSTDRAGR